MGLISTESNTPDLGKFPVYLLRRTSFESDGVSGEWNEGDPLVLEVSGLGIGFIPIFTSILKCLHFSDFFGSSYSDYPAGSLSGLALFAWRNQNHQLRSVRDHPRLKVGISIGTKQRISSAGL